MALRRFRMKRYQELAQQELAICPPVLHAVENTELMESDSSDGYWDFNIKMGLKNSSEGVKVYLTLCSEKQELQNFQFPKDSLKGEVESAFIKCIEDGRRFVVEGKPKIENNVRPDFDDLHRICGMISCSIQTEFTSENMYFCKKEEKVDKATNTEPVIHHSQETYTEDAILYWVAKDMVSKSTEVSFKSSRRNSVRQNSKRLFKLKVSKATQVNFYKIFPKRFSVSSLAFEKCTLAKLHRWSKRRCLRARLRKLSPSKLVSNNNNHLSTVRSTSPSRISVNTHHPADDQTPPPSSSSSSSSSSLTNGIPDTPSEDETNLEQPVEITEVNEDFLRLLFAVKTNPVRNSRHSRHAGLIPSSESSTNIAEDNLESILLAEKIFEQPVHWLNKHKLLPQVPPCSRCCIGLTLKPCKDDIDGWRWECMNSRCNFTRSIRRANFFKDLPHHSLKDVIAVIYHWAFQSGYDDLKKDCSLSPREILIVWKSILQLCAFEVSKCKIGGMNTVEVSNVIYGNYFIAAAMERETRFTRLTVFPSRHQNRREQEESVQIYNTLKTYFKKPTRIITNVPRLHKQIDDDDIMVSYEDPCEDSDIPHHQVKGLLSYLHDKIQMLLGSWSREKLTLDIFQLILYNLQWRERYGRSCEDTFWNMIYQASGMKYHAPYEDLLHETDYFTEGNNFQMQDAYILCNDAVISTDPHYILQIPSDNASSVHLDTLATANTVAYEVEFSEVNTSCESRSVYVHHQVFDNELAAIQQQGVDSDDRSDLENSQINPLVSGNINSMKEMFFPDTAATPQVSNVNKQSSQSLSQLQDSLEDSCDTSEYNPENEKADVEDQAFGTDHVKLANIASGISIAEVEDSSSMDNTINHDAVKGINEVGMINGDDKEEIKVINLTDDASTMDLVRSDASVITTIPSENATSASIISTDPIKICYQMPVLSINTIKNCSETSFVIADKFPERQQMYITTAENYSERKIICIGTTQSDSTPTVFNLVGTDGFPENSVVQQENSTEEPSVHTMITQQCSVNVVRSTESNSEEPGICPNHHAGIVRDEQKVAEFLVEDGADRTEVGQGSSDESAVCLSETSETYPSGSPTDSSVTDEDVRSVYTSMDCSEESADSSEAVKRSDERYICTSTATKYQESAPITHQVEYLESPLDYTKKSKEFPDEPIDYSLRERCTSHIFVGLPDRGSDPIETEYKIQEKKEKSGVDMKLAKEHVVASRPREVCYDKKENCKESSTESFKELSEEPAISPVIRVDYSKEYECYAKTTELIEIPSDQSEMTPPMSREDCHETEIYLQTTEDCTGNIRGLSRDHVVPPVTIEDDKELSEELPKVPAVSATAIKNNNEEDICMEIIKDCTEYEKPEVSPVITKETICPEKDISISADDCTQLTGDLCKRPVDSPMITEDCTLELAVSPRSTENSSEEEICTNVTVDGTEKAGGLPKELVSPDSTVNCLENKIKTKVDCEVKTGELSKELLDSTLELYNKLAVSPESTEGHTEKTEELSEESVDSAMVQKHCTLELSEKPVVPPGSAEVITGKTGEISEEPRDSSIFAEDSTLEISKERTVSPGCTEGSKEKIERISQEFVVSSKSTEDYHAREILTKVIERCIEASEQLSKEPAISPVATEDCTELTGQLSNKHADSPMIAEDCNELRHTPVFFPVVRKHCFEKKIYTKIAEISGGLSKELVESPMITEDCNELTGVVSAMVSEEYSPEKIVLKITKDLTGAISKEPVIFPSITENCHEKEICSKIAEDYRELTAGFFKDPVDCSELIGGLSKELAISAMITEDSSEKEISKITEGCAKLIERIYEEPDEPPFNREDCSVKGFPSSKSIDCRDLETVPNSPKNLTDTPEICTNSQSKISSWSKNNFETPVISLTTPETSIASPISSTEYGLVLIKCSNKAAENSSDLLRHSNNTSEYVGSGSTDVILEPKVKSQENSAVERLSGLSDSMIMAENMPETSIISDSTGYTNLLPRIHEIPSRPSLEPTLHSGNKSGYHPHVSAESSDSNFKSIMDSFIRSPHPDSEPNSPEIEIVYSSDDALSDVTDSRGNSPEVPADISHNCTTISDIASVNATSDESNFVVARVDENLDMSLSTHAEDGFNTHVTLPMLSNNVESCKNISEDSDESNVAVNYDVSNAVADESSLVATNVEEKVDILIDSPHAEDSSHVPVVLPILNESQESAEKISDNSGSSISQSDLDVSSAFTVSSNSQSSAVADGAQENGILPCKKISDNLEYFVPQSDSSMNHDASDIFTVSPKKWSSEIIENIEENGVSSLTSIDIDANSTLPSVFPVVKQGFSLCESSIDDSQSRILPNNFSDNFVASNTVTAASDNESNSVDSTDRLKSNVNISIASPEREEKSNEPVMFHSLKVSFESIEKISDNFESTVSKDACSEVIDIMGNIEEDDSQNSVGSSEQLEKTRYVLEVNEVHSNSSDTTVSYEVPTEAVAVLSADSTESYTISTTCVQTLDIPSDGDSSLSEPKSNVEDIAVPIFRKELESKNSINLIIGKGAFDCTISNMVKIVTYPLSRVMASENQRLECDKRIIALRKNLEADLYFVLPESWIIKHKLLPRRGICPTCHRRRNTLAMCTTGLNGFVTVCASIFLNTCHVSYAKSPKFFRSLESQCVKTALTLIYHWVVQTDVQVVIKELKVNYKEIWSMYTHIRELCSKSLRKECFLLGGRNRIVYATTIRLAQFFILFAMDKTTCMFRAKVYDVDKNRDAPLMTDVTMWCCANTVFVTYFPLSVRDSSPTLAESSDDGDPKSVEVLTELATSVLLSLFNNCKTFMLSADIVQKFLDEVSWRQVFGTTYKHTLRSVIKMIMDNDEVFYEELDKYNELAIEVLMVHAATSLKDPSNAKDTLDSKDLTDVKDITGSKDLSAAKDTSDSKDILELNDNSTLKDPAVFKNPSVADSAKDKPQLKKVTFCDSVPGDSASNDVPVSDSDAPPGKRIRINELETPVGIGRTRRRRPDKISFSCDDMDSEVELPRLRPRVRIPAKTDQSGCCSDGELLNVNRKKQGVKRKQGKNKSSDDDDDEHDSSTERPQQRAQRYVPKRRRRRRQDVEESSCISSGVDDDDDDDRVCSVLPRVPKIILYADDHYNCFICTSIISGKLSFEEHVITHGKNQMDYLLVQGHKRCCNREYDVCLKTIGCSFIVKQRGDRRKKCAPCETWFCTFEELESHNVSVHGNTFQPYSCQVCHYRTSQYKELLDHHHDIEGHLTYAAPVCPYCLTVFPVERDVRNNVTTEMFCKHVLAHQMLDRQECVMCFLSFIDADSLKQHQDKAHTAVEVTSKKLMSYFTGRKYLSEKWATHPVVVKCQDTKVRWQPLKKSETINRCIECKKRLNLYHKSAYSKCSTCGLTTTCVSYFNQHLCSKNSFDCIMLSEPICCSCGFETVDGAVAARHMSVSCPQGSLKFSGTTK